MADTLHENHISGTSIKAQVARFVGPPLVYIYAGMTFTPQTNYTLDYIRTRLRRVGSPGTINFSIYATAGGLPTGAPLAGSDRSSDTITTSSSGAIYRTTLDSPLEVTSGTEYAIVLTAPNSDLNDHIQWFGDASEEYARGQGCVYYENVSAWGGVWAGVGDGWTALPDTQRNWSGWNIYDFDFQTWEIVPDPINISSANLGSGGNFIVAAAENGVFLSTDFGDNWTRYTPDAVETTDWTKCICSGDGTYIITVSDAGAIYRSANSGSSWAEITPAGGDTFSITKLATSDDGQYMAIVGANSTDSSKSLYLSTDYGATWTFNNPITTTTPWTDVDINNDGTTVGVCATAQLYCSFDSGVTWGEQGLTASAEVWTGFSISGNGETALIANAGTSNEYFRGVKTNLYSEATWAETDITSVARGLLDDLTQAAQQTTLGLGTGDSPTWSGGTFSGLTASRIVATGASKELVSLASPLIVGEGGTGLATITDHGILLGSGTGAITPLGVASNGQLPIGSTDADPVLAALTGTANQVSVANGVGTITLALPQDYHTSAVPTLGGLILSGTVATGLDMSGGTFATAVQDWPATPVINVAGTKTIKFEDGAIFNTFLGTDAFSGLPGGITLAQCEASNNIGIGYHAGYNNDSSGGGFTGNRNVYIGYNAGEGTGATTGGYENVALGALALQVVGSGAENVAIGYAAGGSLTTGSRNFCMGSNSGSAMTTQSENICIGWKTAQNMTGTANLAIGKEALKACTGDSNVGLGGVAGINLTSGDYNMYIGVEAGRYNQTGLGNVGIGWRSAGGQAGAVSSANWNVCIGESTGRLLRAGAENVMIGQGAGYDCVTGDDNVLIGRIAGFNVTASSNVMIGYQSGFTATSTDRCIYIGNYSGYRQTTLDDILIIDNRQQASTAAEVTNAIVYGVMHATPASQSLRFNVGTTTWHNATHEDGDGGRANQLNFKGQQSGGEETTLARIEVSHDGAADDQKGQIVISTNDGADGDTPTDRIEVDTAGVVSFLNPGGLPYGSLYLHEGAANVDISTAGADVYVKITGFDAGLMNAVTENADAFNVGKVGVYKVDWQVSADSTGNNLTYEIDIFINGVEQNDGSCRRKFGAAADYGSMSGTAILDITDTGHDIDLRMKQVGGVASDVDIFNMSFNIVQIGGT